MIYKDLLDILTSCIIDAELWNTQDKTPEDYAMTLGYIDGLNTMTVSILEKLKKEEDEEYEMKVL